MSRKKSMNQFLRCRREAFTKAVLEDDWDAVRSYCKKYWVPIPENEKVLKAGTYKAVQGCTDIPKKVKDLAAQKCLDLGFNPVIAPSAGGKK